MILQSERAYATSTDVDRSWRERRARILYVQRPDGGGSATGLRDLIGSLDRRRYEPVVLLYRDGPYREAFRAAGAEVLLLEGSHPRSARRTSRGRGQVKSRRGRVPVAIRPVVRLFLRRELPIARRMAAILRGHEIDLVHHNNNPHANRASVLATALAGLPQVCHVRFLAHYRSRVDRILSQRVDRFIYMSEAIAKQCRGDLRLSRRRGAVIYDPFDFTRYVVTDAEIERVRQQLGLDPADRVVANVGRLVAWKGQDVFLEACAAARAACPNLRALIVGGPGDGTAGRSFVEHLKRKASDLGLGDRVIFTGFRRDVPAIMKASHVIVHSATRPEPFGRVVVEAMAAGRPVVATAAGGVPEIVEHGRDGLLVPLADPVAMAEAMRDLLVNPERAESMGRAGFNHARERFSAERFSAALDDVYRGVLGRVGEGREA